MGGAPYMLTEQGPGEHFKCFSIQPKKSTHFQAAAEQQAASAHVSEPSKHIYITGVTSTITAY